MEGTTDTSHFFGGGSPNNDEPPPSIALLSGAAPGDGLHVRPQLLCIEALEGQGLRGAKLRVSSFGFGLVDVGRGAKKIKF